ncbi:UNVERIFIED_CONTAM: hypothetical protein Cloal_1336 [Acetivibrio alkalicellulosi]
MKQLKQFYNITFFVIGVMFLNQIISLSIRMNINDNYSMQAHYFLYNLPTITTTLFREIFLVLIVIITVIGFKLQLSTTIKKMYIAAIILTIINPVITSIATYYISHAAINNSKLPSLFSNLNEFTTFTGLFTVIFSAIVYIAIVVMLVVSRFSLNKNGKLS